MPLSHLFSPLFPYDSSASSSDRHSTPITTPTTPRLQAAPNIGTASRANQPARMIYQPRVEWFPSIPARTRCKSRANGHAGTTYTCHSPLLSHARGLSARAHSSVGEFPCCRALFCGSLYGVGWSGGGCLGCNATLRYVRSQGVGLVLGGAEVSGSVYMSVCWRLCCVWLVGW